MYYPKSRISKPIKSMSGEFTYPDGSEYIGVYYKTYDKKYFTGENPLSKISTEIFKIPQKEDINLRISRSKQSEIFTKLNPTLEISSFEEPKPYIVKPSEKDYLLGKITRYFAKERKVRIFKIIEIDKDTFIDINNQEGVYNYPGWDVISMFWQISGPKNNEIVGGNVVKAGIIDTNKRIVSMKNKKFIGLDKYITNFLQYSKY